MLMTRWPGYNWYMYSVSGMIKAMWQVPNGFEFPLKTLRFAAWRMLLYSLPGNEIIMNGLKVRAPI